jgi:methionyl-tRNA formyltransferase
VYLCTSLLIYVSTFLLLSLDSPFSRTVLQTILDVGHPPAALILPNPDRTASLASFPALTNQPTDQLLPTQLPNTNTLTQTASLHQIPLLTLGSLRHPGALAALRANKPDFLVTACFPRLLPADMLAIPRVGCLNLHPSLLPAYRGPEPLFWQYYFGETRTGVTLHWMDEGADTGDLLAQAEVPFPDGISLAEAETRTALVGGALLARALADPQARLRIPQPAQGGSAHPRPTADSLVISTAWTARRAFNFLCAARAWGPFEIVEEGSGQRLRVRGALGWGHGAGTMPLFQTGEEGVAVRFTDGVVQVERA